MIVIVNGKNMTKVEAIAKSLEWLDKAVRFEAEWKAGIAGKTEKHRDMAFRQALAYEDAAYASA